jgi:hypothetical protein
MRADLLLAPQRSFSGVHCRQEGDFSHHVEALAQAILRHAEDSKIATWCVVELLPLLKPFHWSAYAASAQIPAPSQIIIDAAIVRFRELIQYPADAQPVTESFRTF